MTITRGTRVELVHMDDPYTRLPAGERGTVTFVDDLGTVHVRWDCGSTLGLIAGQDRFTVLGPCEHARTGRGVDHWRCLDCGARLSREGK